MLRKWPIAALLLLLVLAGSALAQTTPPAAEQGVQSAPPASLTMSGKITDDEGNQVEGARVTILNKATGETQTATTGSTGDYSFTGLPQGSYSVTVEKEGHIKVEGKDVTLLAGILNPPSDFVLKKDTFTLLRYFWQAGVNRWPLLLCSIFGLVFIIERYWSLSRVKINTAEIITRVRRALQAGDLSAGQTVCDTLGGPIANTVKAGLLRFGTPTEEVEKAMEAVATQEIARMEKYLWILATIAMIAPLFGFLGTVTGMIQAFDRLAEVGLGNPRAVASGISEALITTAWGLFIALPVQLAFNYFTTRVSNAALGMETGAAMLVETFRELEHVSPAPEGPRPVVR